MRAIRNDPKNKRKQHGYDSAGFAAPESRGFFRRWKEKLRQKDQTSDTKQVNQAGATSPDASVTSNSHTPSLWDRAYDHLKSEDAELIAKYEGLLSEELGSQISRAPAQRVTQFHSIVDIGLKRLDERKITVKIGGQKIVLQDQIASAAEFLEWAKDWISDAVKASPEASLAWAVVCVGLPFLTKPAAAEKACFEGFQYVSSRMRYYVALETLMLPAASTPNYDPERLRKEFETHVIELYGQILAFQIKSVLRFYHGSLRVFFQDVRGKEDWVGMRKAIECLEETVYRDSNQISSLSSRQLLDHMARDGSASLKMMQRLISSTEEQLKVIEEHRDISAAQLFIQKEHLEMAKKEAGRKLLSEEDCIRLFRVVDHGGSNEGDYEWYKDRVERRIDGTCEWFLNHPSYQVWKRATSGPLLVSADPGCGKSVLAKYLIDHELPRPDTTICYFFFKEQDQNTFKQALCSMIHQLLKKKPALTEHVLPEFANDGEKLVNLNSSLWSIFANAVRDDAAGCLVFVIDALDECLESELATLIRKLKTLFQELKYKLQRKIKFILTSRPYGEIVSEFQELVEDFPYIRIPGEDASEQISQEVNCVIEDRVRKLARKQNLKSEIELTLKERLLQVPHRTYLWVYLVFDYLSAQGFQRKTKQGVEKTLATLPQTIYEAYEKILARVSSDHRETVQRALSIVLIAARPLALEEMNIALNIEESSTSIDDLDLEDEESFKGRLRQWCGLFVSVSRGQVYLLHQTARSFLLQKAPTIVSLNCGNGTSQSSTHHPWLWQGSVDSLEANAVLATACIMYLRVIDGKVNEEAESKYLNDYSIINWTAHFVNSHPDRKQELAYLALPLFDLAPPSRRNWPEERKRHFYLDGRAPSSSADGLIVASHLGLSEVVELLISESNVDVRGLDGCEGNVSGRLGKSSELRCDLSTSEGWSEY